MKPKALFGTIVGIVLVLDIITKQLVLAFMKSKSVPVLGSVLSLTYRENTGAGFGLLEGRNAVFIVIAIIALGIIIYYLREAWHSKLLTLALALIFAGALGNLIDRIAYGFVVDFIDFHWWPAFNVADSAITIGGILLAWHWWKDDCEK
ncbi:signal peptidase II [Candidatus Woesearchaeota archaeon]|nr:signal peptidase II [Candidatus Woesearchaeota archaeon]